MGLLDNFERGLERAVNGAFAKTFKSGLQPVEITSALRRELDTQAAVVSRDRILVPNNFTVRLSQTDYQRMSGLGSTLISELTELVQRHATAQHYSFSGGIGITLVPDEALSQGMIEVDSVSVKGTVAWTPVLEINGTRHPLVHSRTIIGRGSEADITVDDNGISRKHVEILWDGSKAEVNDLNSTNGSKLNGSPVSRAPLAPESVIDIGRTRIVFRVLAQSADVDQPADRRNDRGFTL
ncbi:FhaA domain-containing protein [Rhodoglobus sp.]